MAWYHQETPLLLIVLTLFVNGISMGLWSTPNQVITVNATPKSKFGPVGALINLTRNTGNVIGQAIATAVIAAVLGFQGFDIELSQMGIMEGSVEAFTHAWRAAIWSSFVCSALPFSLLPEPVLFLQKTRKKTDFLLVIFCPEDFRNIPFGSLADLFNGQVIRVVSEGVFDFKSNFFYAYKSIYGKKHSNQS